MNAEVKLAAFRRNAGLTLDKFYGGGYPADNHEFACDVIRDCEAFVASMTDGPRVAKNAASAVAPRATGKAPIFAPSMRRYP